MAHAVRSAIKMDTYNTIQYRRLLIHSDTKLIPENISDISALRWQMSAKILIYIKICHKSCGLLRSGNCSFSASGPTAWKRFPNHVKNVPSLETIRLQLRAYLFKQSLSASQ